MAVDGEYGDLVSAPEILRGDRATLDRQAADRVAQAVEARLSEASHAVLGVVGGRSVGGIYAALRDRALAWDRIHVFLADERLVPVSSDESNWKLVRADLLTRSDGSPLLPMSNGHPYPFDPARPEAGVLAYDRALADLGGRFDVAILSAGEDGHTASLFPDHPSVRDDAGGFVLVEDSPKPPPRRVSASRTLLERTGLGVLVFYGEAKRAALDLFLADGTDIEACPSRVVASMKRGLVLTDLA